MNKITLTLEVEDGKLKQLIDLLISNENPTQPQEPAPVKEKVLAMPKTEAPTPMESTSTPVTVPATTVSVSKTDIRKAALALSKAGKQTALQAVYAKYGAEKLSDFTDENLYPAVLKDLEDANA